MESSGIDNTLFTSKAFSCTLPLLRDAAGPIFNAPSRSFSVTTVAAPCSLASRLSFALAPASRALFVLLCAASASMSRCGGAGAPSSRPVKPWRSVRALSATMRTSLPSACAEAMRCRAPATTASPAGGSAAPREAKSVEHAPAHGFLHTNPLTSILNSALSSRYKPCSRPYRYEACNVPLSAHG